MHRLLTLFLLILAAIVISGCTFHVKNQELMLRPGFRVPQRSVDQGDGEQVIWEEMDPDGTSMFLFIRGEL